MSVDWAKDFVLPLVVTVIGSTLAAGTIAVAADLIKNVKGRIKRAEKATVRRRGSRRWDFVTQALQREWLKIVIAVAAITTAMGVVILAINLGSVPATNVASEPEGDKSTGVADFSLADWGPERITVSSLSRNSVVTLNSMIDNPVQGDERNFSKIKPQNAPDSAYSDHIVVEPGAVYTLYYYFSNNARESESESVATGTRLTVRAPGVFTRYASIFGELRSENSSPAAVWDGATIVLGANSAAAALRYVQGSARIHSAGAVDGSLLDADKLFSAEGVELGCDSLDGRLPSAGRCSGYVTFDVRVDQPDFVVTAEARLKGSDEPYLDHVEARAGQVIQVRIQYSNTGSTQQDNVSVRAILPAGFRYINESTVIANSTTNGQYVETMDGVAATGLNAGSYAPMGNFFVRFDIMVENAAAFGGPGIFTVPEIARVTTNGGYKNSPLTFILLDSE